MKKKDLKPDDYDVAEIDPHYAIFLDCMRTRKWQDLNAEILQGHMSTSMMHLGNIAYRTGRKLTFNGQHEKFVNDAEADSFLTREYRDPYVLPKDI